MPLILFAFLLTEAAIIATAEGASSTLVIILAVVAAVFAVIAYVPLGGGTWGRRP